MTNNLNHISVQLLEICFAVDLKLNLFVCYVFKLLLLLDSVNK